MQHDEPTAVYRHVAVPGRNTVHSWRIRLNSWKQRKISWRLTRRNHHWGLQMTVMKRLNIVTS